MTDHGTHGTHGREHDCPGHGEMWNDDAGGRARPTGAVSSTQGDLSQSGDQDMAGQLGITTPGSLGGPGRGRDRWGGTTGWPVPHEGGVSTLHTQQHLFGTGKGDL